ncbi:MAG TPA: hypothetical protein VFZ43_09950 [Anaerolineales bacterium]
MTNRVINIFAFAVLTLLWLAFAGALLFNRDLLDTTWQSFRSWPLIIQLVAGLLVLPVVLGLWIWETSWPLLLRVILVAGLAWVTVYTFFPRKVPGKLEVSPGKP